jgi:hypothetical protein
VNCERLILILILCRIAADKDSHNTANGIESLLKLGNITAYNCPPCFNVQASLKPPLLKLSAMFAALSVLKVSSALQVSQQPAKQWSHLRQILCDELPSMNWRATSKQIRACKGWFRYLRLEGSV